MKDKQRLYERLLAIIFAGTAIGIEWFWYQFFNDLLFTVEELSPLIENFQGYYDWEKSFVIPDTILAIGMLISSIMLWFGLGAGRAQIAAAVCAGAALFLGVLDLSYGFSTGLYEINHPFASEVLSSGISITVVGLFALIILLRTPGRTEPDNA